MIRSVDARGTLELWGEYINIYIHVGRSVESKLIWRMGFWLEHTMPDGAWNIQFLFSKFPIYAANMCKVKLSKWILLIITRRLRFGPIITDVIWSMGDVDGWDFAFFNFRWRKQNNVSRSDHYESVESSTVSWIQNWIQSLEFTCVLVDFSSHELIGKDPWHTTPPSCHRITSSLHANSQSQSSLINRFLNFPIT